MYAFLMDKGQLVHLDPNLKSQNVLNLRNALACECELPLEKQILLVSGGFQLEPGDKLSMYDAGLFKTNPIYVFTRVDGSGKDIQTPDVLKICDGGFPQQIERRMDSPPSLQCLHECISLVENLTHVAEETCKAVEQLVFEQRQMVQGWCAALANLAEAAADCEKRATAAKGRLTQFESCNSEWEANLQSVPDLKTELSKVPLLPQLTNQLGGFWDQKETSTTPAVHPPTNLYEWVCFQLTLSYGMSRARKNLPLSNADRLKIAALYLGRPEMLHGGRSRTTSAELSGYGCSPKSGGGLLPPTELTNRTSMVFDNKSQYDGNTLTVTCSNSSPALRQKMFCHSSVGSDGSSGDSETPTIGYDASFLSMIQSAQSDLSLLRFGEDGGAPPGEEGQTRTGEMTYTRKQIALLSGLLALVSRCSTSVEGGSKRESSGVDFEQIAAEIADGDQYLNSSVLKETHEALDLVCFSQRLSYLDPLSHEACQHVDKITSVKTELSRVYERAVTKKDSSIVTQKSGIHHEQLQHLLTAFRLLCDIFNRVMGSKLELADILRQRQQWLQSFQSEIHRLDATIQTCVRRIGRVTTTGTLLSQLRGAPEIYIRGLVEVIRQQEFDSVFAENVREQKMVQANESNRRRTFAKHLKGNILHALFTPWTGAKAERWSISKLSGSRNFSTLDLDGAEGFTESMGKQLTISTQPRAATSTLGLDRQREVRRISINSRSEPRLDEMINTPPTSRLSLRFRQKDAFINRKLSELVEDEVSTIKSAEMPPRSRNLSSADLPERQRSSMLGYPQQHPPVPDALRRASVPVESLSSIPKWTIDDNTTLDTPIESPNVTTDVPTGRRFISREELAKLAASLPPYLSEILHSELSKCGTGRAVSGPCVPNPHVQHIGMSLSAAPQPSSRELTESPNITFADASCQTDHVEFVNSTSIAWTSRSHSASLVMPADSSSPQRPLVEELLPSSLCSWELCHGSPVRTVRHSMSTNVLAFYSEMTTTAVQTDEIPEEAAQPPTEVHGPPQDLANLSAEVRRKLEGLGTDIPSGPDSGQSRGDVPSGIQMDSVLSLISNLNLEDQQGGDAEFATPTTMMSCSFHSTRTNLSNTEDAIADISASELHGVTPTMDRPPFLTQSIRHSCSPTIGLSRQISAPVSSSGDDNCSCHLHHLHCACLEVMHQLITELSSRSFDKSTPDRDAPFSDSSQIHHMKQLISHLSYLRSNPPSVCPVHPDSYPHPRTPVHPVAENRAGATSLQCIPSSVSVQTDSPPVSASRTYYDRETSITPPSSLDRADHPREGVDNASPSNQLVPSSPSLCDELVGMSPSSSTSLSHLVCWKPIAPLTGPSAYLTNPLSLSSVRMLERFLKFAHSNFTCNDCVVFVPVRGAVQHSSPQKLSTCDETGADDESNSPPAALSKAISPSSSLLSSTIIQSMESTLPNTNLALPRIRNVMHTSIGPNVDQSTSALVGDLFSSPPDEKMDLSALLPSSARLGTKSRHIRGRAQPKSKISQSSESSLTQWRMLSSDGHVYFLHQDDFSALNLDPRVDYCQPACSVQNLNLIRSRHSVKGAARSSSTKQRETPGPSTPSDPEARSYFVVATYLRKERCLSKRTDNRFNLPKNFAFYRVRVKPLNLTADATGLKSTTAPKSTTAQDH